MEERERVPAAVCVRVSYILTHVYALITFTRLRESSSMCRTSLPRARAYACTCAKERAGDTYKGGRGWPESAGVTVLREAPRECRVVERVYELHALCECKPRRRYGTLEA